MEIIKVAAFAFVALMLITSLKSIKADIAIYISLCAGILIVLFLIPKLQIVIQFLNTISNKTHIDIVYLNTIFKVLGIAYITTFCSEICKDAGAGSLASKVEFAGKILILTLGIPIIMAVLQSILKFI